MAFELYDGQKDALNRMSDGKILCGGVGSGKSIVGIAYFLRAHVSEPLRIITTAAKRDSLEWEGDLAKFGLSKHDRDIQIDSWNNIAKYASEEGCFFIFDEQRLVGSGAWVKSFYKIARRNNWILLSATPGDVWMDYVPVFVANGYYKNKTEFARRHVVYNPYTKYPSVMRYLEEGRLRRLAARTLVTMETRKRASKHPQIVTVSHSEGLYSEILESRFDPWKNEPLRGAGELCYALRKAANSSPDRLEKVVQLCKEHPRAIIFYNFDYELEELRKLRDILGVTVAERNGHRHDPLPNEESWVYLVQYAAGAEAWNCITTDTIIFYSLSYSWKTMHQAEGRIDRVNTPYPDLYYYRLVSDSGIDRAITRALNDKGVFNQKNFAASLERKP